MVPRGQNELILSFSVAFLGHLPVSSSPFVPYQWGTAISGDSINGGATMLTGRLYCGLLTPRRHFCGS